MKHFKLTPNQEQVMETLWREQRPLVRSEIIALTENRKWSESSIHLLINELLEKQAIKVEGEILMGINMARQYSPAVSREEFDIMQMECRIEELQPSMDTILKLFAEILDRAELDEETLNQFQAIIDDKRNNM